MYRLGIKKFVGPLFWFSAYQNLITKIGFHIWYIPMSDSILLYKQYLLTDFYVIYLILHLPSIHYLLLYIYLMLYYIILLIDIRGLVIWGKNVNHGDKSFIVIYVTLAFLLFGVQIYAAVVQFSLSKRITLNLKKLQQVEEVINFNQFHL